MSQARNIMRDPIREVVRSIERGVGSGFPSFSPLLTTLRDHWSNTLAESGIRNSTATFWDYNEVLRTSPIDEHRFNRGRRVENLLTYSEDLINAAWIASGGATKDDANTITFTAAAADFVAQNFNTDIAEYILTYDAWVDSGTKDFRISAASTTDGFVAASVTATTTRQRFALAITKTAAESLNVRIHNNSGATAGTIHATNMQLVNITGQPAGYVPEYVPTEATAESQLFDTTSGNTVASNIVTEAAGDPLHPFSIIDGAKVWDTKEDWSAKAWAAGSECNYLGKWYSTVSGGTDVTFGSAVTWVEQGIHWNDFGVLAEGAVQNKCTNYNANPDAGLTNLTKSGDAAAIMTRVADATELANAGLDALCTDGNVIKLDNSGGAGTADITITGTVGNTNKHSLSVWWRGSGVGRIFTTGVAGSNKTMQATYERVENTNITPAGAGAQMVIRANAGAVIYFILNQLEESPIVSSEIVTAGSAVTRAEEMGNIKWNDAFFNQPENTTIVDWVPDFASGDIAAISRAILTLNNAALSVVFQLGTGVDKVSTYDGTNFPVATITWAKNDCIRLIVSASTQANELIISYRNMSNGDSFTFVAAVAYDGAFTSTGFLQWLKAAGGNNSLFRGIHNYERALSEAEKESKFG